MFYIVISNFIFLKIIIIIYQDGNDFKLFASVFNVAVSTFILLIWLLIDVYIWFILSFSSLILFILFWTAVKAASVVILMFYKLAMHKLYLLLRAVIFSWRSLFNLFTLSIEPLKIPFFMSKLKTGPLLAIPNVTYRNL